MLFEEINELCGVFAVLGSGASLKSRVTSDSASLVRLYLLRADLSERITPAWNISHVTFYSTSTVIMQSQKISLISMMRQEAGVDAFQLDNKDAKTNAAAVASNVKDAKATTDEMTLLPETQHAVSGVGQPANSLASCAINSLMNFSTNSLPGRPAPLKH